MGNRRFIFLLVLTIGGAAPAQEPAKWQTAADGKLRFPLPHSWNVETMPQRDRAVLSLEIEFEDESVRLDLLCWEVQDKRAFAYHERDIVAANAAKRTAEVLLEPLTHLIVRCESAAGTPKVLAIAYRWKEGNVVTLFLDTPAALWPKLREGFLEAGLGLEITLPPSPSVPPGYTTIAKGDHIYVMHPDVPKKKRVVADLHKIASRESRAHLRRHGPLPKHRQRTMQILVHARKADAHGLEPRAASVPDGTYLDQLRGRLFTVPLHSDAERAAFAQGLNSLWYVRRYGSHEPWWFFRGDAAVAWREATARKKLPSVPRRSLANMPTLEPFAKLLSLERNTVKRFDDHAFCYMALFLIGPKKYRAAFEAFQAELQRSGDWKTAQEVHLLALDQGELLRDAQKFCSSKLKAAKR